MICNMILSVATGDLTLGRRSQKTFALMKQRRKPDDLNPQTHRAKNFESRKTNLKILPVFLYGRETSPAALRDAVNS